MEAADTVVFKQILLRETRRRICIKWLVSVGSISRPNRARELDVGFLDYPDDQGEEVDDKVYLSLPMLA